MKSSALRRWLVLPFWLAAAAPALAAPAYIKADRAAVEKGFEALMARDLKNRSQVAGVITGNIFSDRLTSSRKKLVADSLKKNPVPGCSGTPAFALVAVTPLYANEKDGTGWEERLEIACKPDAVHRTALFTVTQKSGVQMTESVPGETRVAVKQRNQFLPKLIEAAGGEGCEAKKIRVLDARALTKPESAGEPWTELWKVNACGKVKEIEVALTPGEGGAATTWQFTPKDTASTPAEGAPKEAAPDGSPEPEAPPQ